MKAILSQMAAAVMLARDWHYNASGAAFYAQHLLADEVAKVGDSADEIAEVYYLGERGTVPPSAGEIATDALAVYNAAKGETCPARLAAVLKLLAAHAEEVARGNISIGAKSLLDGVSAQCYKFVGLIERTAGL